MIMKLLRVVLLMCCLCIRPMFAMDNDGKCMPVVKMNGPLFLGAGATALNLTLIKNEYNKRGCTSECAMLTGTLCALTLLTGTMAYLAGAQQCNQ